MSKRVPDLGRPHEDRPNSFPMPPSPVLTTSCLYSFQEKEIGSSSISQPVSGETEVGWVCLHSYPKTTRHQASEARLRLVTGDWEVSWGGAKTMAMSSPVLEEVGKRWPKGPPCAGNACYILDLSILRQRRLARHQKAPLPFSNMVLNLCCQ